MRIWRAQTHPGRLCRVRPGPSPQDGWFIHQHKRSRTHSHLEQGLLTWPAHPSLETEGLTCLPATSQPQGDFKLLRQPYRETQESLPPTSTILKSPIVPCTSKSLLSEMGTRGKLCLTEWLGKAGEVDKTKWGPHQTTFISERGGAGSCLTSYSERHGGHSLQHHPASETWFPTLSACQVQQENSRPLQLLCCPLATTRKANTVQIKAI